MRRLASGFEKMAEKGGIILPTNKNLSFIIGMAAILGSEEDGSKHDKKYVEALLDSFGDERVSTLHVTVLNGGDIVKVNGRHSDGRSMGHTRRVAKRTIKELKAGGQASPIHGRTAGADIFRTHSGESRIGFYLDEQTSQRVMNLRGRLLDKLDVEGGTYRDPHISIAAPSDRRYAHYIVDALNHSVEALDVTLNEIYAGRLVSQDRSEAAQPELVFAGK